ncbi:hypothetical protein MIB92_14695 [Aestuariirhabdus sp. Z084]|uniref:hypothetical protein n=1 Tax=Aestuariirhabdus haliotis TaxID=2918751 RepID=UPI00201B4421|nr:hypothetical protein [Aestuariirhabdus haliotis]MCL6416907.1 hypothetical protein [Aestuariirhabdus haliotis]MCL6420931.1 hypothetical protein [Aestuariirhabdus haliotis]
MSKKRLLGKIGKAKNGYLSYDIENAKSSFFPVFCQLLETQFDAKPVGPPTSYVSEILGDVKIGEVVLGWGWDNWSGVYLMALTPEGDNIVQEVAGVIDPKLKKERFECHVHM